MLAAPLAFTATANFLSLAMLLRKEPGQWWTYLLIISCIAVLGCGASVAIYCLMEGYTSLSMVIVFVLMNVLPAISFMVGA